MDIRFHLPEALQAISVVSYDSQFRYPNESTISRPPVDIICGNRDRSEGYCPAFVYDDVTSAGKHQQLAEIQQNSHVTIHLLLRLPSWSQP